MQRGSSVNFQPVKSAALAVAHANREIAPEYLLPPDKSLGTIVLIDDKGKVASTLETKMALASRQAKRQGDYSPIWEGVINLRSPMPGEDPKKYKSICSGVVAMWCDEYTKITGHKVLRADIHLDEGRIDADTGEVLFNAHAHVMADKTNDLGRVLKVNAPMLRKIQDFTSEITGLKRGENSLKTGRKHIGHQAYKALAEQGRLETRQVKDQLKDEAAANVLMVSAVEQVKFQLDRETKLNTHNIKSAQAARGEVKELKDKLSAKDAEIARYKAERDALKASGEATQKDYQAIKKSHLEALAEIQNLKEKVEKMDEYTQKLNAELVRKDAQIASELVAKAEVIEALVQSGQKSEALLVTSEGHREAAAKLLVRHEAFKVKAQAKIDEIIGVANEKIGGLTAENTKLTDENMGMKWWNDLEPWDRAKWMKQAGNTGVAADAWEAFKATQRGQHPSPTLPTREGEGRPAGLPAVPSEKAGHPGSGVSTASLHGAVPHTPKTPTPPEIAAYQARLQERQGPVEAPKAITHPITPPAPTKSLKTLLNESYEAFVAWIKGKGGTVEPIDRQRSDHFGPVVQLDDLHAVQSTGRGKHVIHDLANLDKVPDLDNPKMEIKYRDGVGQVHGNGPEQARRPVMR